MFALCRQLYEFPHIFQTRRLMCALPIFVLLLLHRRRRHRLLRLLQFYWTRLCLGSHALHTSAQFTIPTKRVSYSLNLLRQPIARQPHFSATSAMDLVLLLLLLLEVVVVKRTLRGIRRSSTIIIELFCLCFSSFPRFCCCWVPALAFLLRCLNFSSAHKHTTGRLVQLLTWLQAREQLGRGGGV